MHGTGNGSSLFNDESILSHHTNQAINHSSLIVGVQSSGPDPIIYSQERNPSILTKNRTKNANSELRKSSKAPLNNKKATTDQLFAPLLKQAMKQKKQELNKKKQETGRMPS